MTMTQIAYASLQKSQLRGIINEMVRQGPQHEKNIENILDILYIACENEFTEDGPATLKAYLTERFNTVLNKH